MTWIDNKNVSYDVMIRVQKSTREKLNSKELRDAVREAKETYYGAIKAGTVVDFLLDFYVEKTAPKKKESKKK